MSIMRHQAFLGIRSIDIYNVFYGLGFQIYMKKITRTVTVTRRCKLYKKP